MEISKDQEKIIRHQIRIIFSVIKKDFPWEKNKNHYIIPGTRVKVQENQFEILSANIIKGCLTFIENSKDQKHFQKRVDMLIENSKHLEFKEISDIYRKTPIEVSSCFIQNVLTFSDKKFTISYFKEWDYDITNKELTRHKNISMEMFGLLEQIYFMIYIYLHKKRSVFMSNFIGRPFDEEFFKN